MFCIVVPVNSTLSPHETKWSHQFLTKSWHHSFPGKTLSCGSCCPRSGLWDSFARVGRTGAARPWLRVTGLFTWLKPAMRHPRSASRILPKCRGEVRERELIQWKPVHCCLESEERRLWRPQGNVLCSVLSPCSRSEHWGCQAVRQS